MGCKKSNVNVRGELTKRGAAVIDVVQERSLFAPVIGILKNFLPFNNRSMVRQYELDENMETQHGRHSSSLPTLHLRHLTKLCSACPSKTMHDSLMLNAASWKETCDKMLRLQHNYQCAYLAKCRKREHYPKKGETQSHSECKHVLYPYKRLQQQSKKAPRLSGRDLAKHQRSNLMEHDQDRKCPIQQWKVSHTMKHTNKLTIGVQINTVTEDEWNAPSNICLASSKESCSSDAAKG